MARPPSAAMPPKRSFSDDYRPSSEHNPSSYMPKRRKPFPANEWRRPTATHEWWTVSEPEWDRMQPAMKRNWTHVGRIMETEEGEPAPAPCEQCVSAGVPRQCRVYSREALRRYGFKTHVCAKCRATAKVCSLNPHFRNSVGLRNSNPPPPQSSSWSGDGGHRYTSPGPDQRYRSATPPSERHPRMFPPSPAQWHRFPSPSERDRFPPVNADRQRIFSPELHGRYRTPTPPTYRSRPPMSPPEKHVPSLDSLIIRMESFEDQMEAMRKENLQIRYENDILHWRLAKLERPNEVEPKPPASLTTEQSASAVETLVMEESIASTLREQQQEQEPEQEQQEHAQVQQHDKEVESALEAERQRRRQEEEEEEEEQRDQHWRQQEEEREQRWAAEIDTLRAENSALTRRVLELEKGHSVTQQIFRDMYYALDD